MQRSAEVVQRPKVAPRNRLGLSKGRAKQLPQVQVERRL